MKLNKKDAGKLFTELRLRYGPELDELQKQGLRLVGCLKTMDGFESVDPDPLLDIQHIGRVIVDAVLQVGHNYERQVRKRVKRIIRYPEAATVSGFIKLLREKGISQVLDWHSQAMEDNLLLVARFFANQGIDTYSELQEWLKLEEHRDNLLELRGSNVFKVGNKTADYFRLLVYHWDTVAVDSKIETILKKAGISSKYDYKEKRTIVQLAALQMGLTPIELDASIYDDSVAHPERYKRSRRVQTGSVKPVNEGIDYGQTSLLGNNFAETEGSDINMVGSMPEKRDLFKGKINDLSQSDAKGWRRRDIGFFKDKVNGGGKFGYPTQSDQIVLIDTDCKRYELNFSKPDLEDKVCLGTPSRLKPWYRKKGFDERTVNPDDRVYFEYTGHGIEFIILTEQEYKLKYNK